jgi:hypothetical protein
MAATPSTKKSVLKKAVTKKAVAKKAPAKKAAPKKAAPKKSAIKKASAKKAARKSVTLSYQKRYQKIAEAAYLRSEEQGFIPGNEMDNWLIAEQQIDGWIKKDKIKLVE